MFTFFHDIFISFCFMFHSIGFNKLKLASWSCLNLVSSYFSVILAWYHWKIIYIIKHSYENHQSIWKQNERICLTIKSAFLCRHLVCRCKARACLALNVVIYMNICVWIYSMQYILRTLNDYKDQKPLLSFPLLY